MVQSCQNFGFKLGMGCVIAFALGCAASAPAYAADVSISVRPSIQGYYVSGDAGRFREDRKTIDQTSGGIESLHVKADGFEFMGHALAKYDLGGRLLINQNDSLTVNSSIRQFRAYYDGSNEPWYPTGFGLGESFADATDDNMYVEWTNGNIETNYKLTEDLSAIGGIEFWGRDGRKTLLRGSLARQTGLNTRSIPATRDMEGRSETYYVELPMQIAEGYDVAFRQSYENYREDQDIRHYRYLASGVLDQARTFQDYPTFDDLQTQIVITAEPTENVVFTGGYLHDWLKNQTLRSSVRPPSIHFIDPEVENLRRSNTFNGGMIWNNAAGIKDLRLSTAMRIEDADTESRGVGYSSTGSTQRDSRSDLEELRVAESISLVYGGINRTVISASADLEQRKLTWSEFFDAGAYEIGDPAKFAGPTAYSYDTDIDFTNQVYTLRVVNRPHRLVKWSAKYRQKDKIRDYDISTDTSSSFYPGVLGDQDQDVNELSAKVDVRCPKGWTTGFQYQYVNDAIAYGNITEDAQKLRRNRYSASVFGPITPDLSLLFTGMVDRFLIETPTNTSAEDWNPGDGVYDYDGDLYIFNLTANYLASDRATVNTTYQQTASQGDNQNMLYEVWAGLKYRLNDEHTLDLRYEFFDFNDENSARKDFDSYHGHGLYARMTWDF